MTHFEDGKEMYSSYGACFPVFSCFSKVFLFSCYLLFFLFVCFFQVKILNFQLFFYTRFLQILENLENSINFIKVREKSGIFNTEGAVYILSFIFKNDFFLVYFLAYFIELVCFKALLYLY